jgi:magnesium chelatase family protein
VTIVRGQRALVFPTRFMLVSATNPCPCGYAGVGDRCSCSEVDIRRHQRRLSGPLLDRMDMHVDVQRPTGEDLLAEPVTDSTAARELVTDARERQRRRLEGTPASCNGDMDAGLIQSRIRLDDGAQAVLGSAYLQGTLSARGRHRVLRVAQTIADLDGHDLINSADVYKAILLRQRFAGAETLVV